VNRFYLPAFDVWIPPLAMADWSVENEGVNESRSPMSQSEPAMSRKESHGPRRGGGKSGREEIPVAG
jgi:hypothetical protein